MGTIREQLTNMFSKVMAGTVTREEGTMLINHLARDGQADTTKELAFLIDNPPPGVFAKTILHTIALSRNKAFFNLMISSLEHKNEDLSILAAQELARLKTSDAKHVLTEHLNSEAYHVRKVSALALVEGFSDGPEILKKHILAHAEPFYRSTSAEALTKCGENGTNVLIYILQLQNTGAAVTAAQALDNMAGKLTSADIPKIIEALMLAGDRKDSLLIIELLKLVSHIGRRAKGFEGYVKVFSDHPSKAVHDEAANAIKMMGLGISDNAPLTNEN